MGILLVYDVTDEKSFNSESSLWIALIPYSRNTTRIRSLLNLLHSTMFLLDETLLPPTFIFLDSPCDRVLILLFADIRTWHSNIEQHASAGVNKILIGNKCDWDEKRAVSLDQGRALADEFGLRFLETSAKANEGVEEAFFTLARSITLYHSKRFAHRRTFQGYQDPPDRLTTGSCGCTCFAWRGPARSGRE